MRETILFIAGFGDGADMFASLADTVLAKEHDLVFLDLPGFAGAAPLPSTSLDSLSEYVYQIAREKKARMVVAHSVASIIATLAALREPRKIDVIFSMEGNLTAEDAYFSGAAADYPDPNLFKTVFLEKLEEMGQQDPIIRRYRELVAKADPEAMWQLGCDARRFSDSHHPGTMLQSAAEVYYLYNPANCPDASMTWLQQQTMTRILLDDASHWPSVDHPQLLSEKIIEVLRNRAK